MNSLQQPDTPNIEKRSLANLTVCLLDKAAIAVWLSNDPMNYSGVKILEQVHPEDIERVTNLLSRCMFTGDPVEFEARGTDGQDGYVPWRVRLYRLGKDVSALSVVSIGQILLRNREEIRQDEEEILRYLADDRTLREISEMMFLSESTIDTKMRHLKAKLGVRNIGGLVAVAITSGLI